jgi:prepilin-type N-terminal cleavage/methylation domain-containing protein
MSRARKHYIRRGPAAFTLAELAVVITIMGILAAVAVPRFANALARQRRDQAVNRISTDLEYARRRAVQTSTPITVVFDVANDRYTLQDVPDIDRPGKDYTVDLSVEPYSVHILAADFGGNAKVTYDIYGVPDSDGGVAIDVKENGADEVKVVAVKRDGGGAAEVVDVDVDAGDGTVSVTVGGNTLEITIPGH